MLIESGAGEAAALPDSQYAEAGAEVGRRRALPGRRSSSFSVGVPGSAEIAGLGSDRRLIA